MENEHKARRRVPVIAAVVAAAVAVAIIIYAMLGYTVPSEVSVISEDTSFTAAESGICGMDGGIAAYGRSGVSFVDFSGQVLWDYGHGMSNPVAVSSGGYGAVADIGAKTAIVFNESGVTGDIATEYPISCISVAETGFAAVAQTQGQDTYIKFYNNDGSPVDMEIKTTFSGSGYPIAIALSPDGKTLAAGLVELTKSAVGGRLVIYDFSGNSDSGDNIRAYFNYDDTFISDVAWLSSDRIFVAADTGLYFYSFGGSDNVELTNKITPEDEYIDVIYTSGMVGAVTLDEGRRKLAQYDTSGALTGAALIEIDYSSIRYGGDCAILSGGTKMQAVGANGRNRFLGDVGQDVLNVYFTDDDTFLLFGGDALRKMRVS